VARRTGETRDHALAFAPLSVTLHAMSAAADRDDYEAALRHASEVRLPAGYLPTGRAHF
jgi:hypothetical protein